MSKEVLTKLIKYEKWCCAEILNTLDSNNIQNENINTWLTHILFCTEFYYNQFMDNNASNDAQLWPTGEAVNFKSRFNKIHSQWLDYINQSTEGQLQRQFPCTVYGHKLKGTHSDYLVHLTNHNTYHRSQINGVIETIMGKHLILDYIWFVTNT